MNVNYYIEAFTQLWDNSTEEETAMGPVVLLRDKIQKEEQLIAFSGQMKNEVDVKKMDGTARKKLMEQLNANLGAYFKNLFNFTNGEAAIIANKGFSIATKTFMKMARSFDKNIKIEDVFQASRNLWIINSLQIMMEEPVVVTPSIFAYSMLYPYSDNYLDDPAISATEKIAFSHRFELRLKGEPVTPANFREKQIFELVGMIEGDWNRKEYPEVFESLLAIHDAQTRSIFLLHEKKEMNEEELMSICIDKGGTSVLADGYLINGSLTPEQEKFCFGFGTFLQFVDDIQDLHEDSTEGLETVFTYAAKNSQLEKYVNRTISFSYSVMNDLSCFSTDNLNDMKGLMVKSVNFLLIEAIGLNEQLFGRDYVLQMEEYAPFRFEFIRKRRSKMDANRISMMKKMEKMLFKEEEFAFEA